VEWTIAEKDLLDQTLTERWSRVQSDFWEDLKPETVRAVKRLLETRLEIEVQDLIGAPRWKRERAALVHRNGHYQRTLLTSVGWIRPLKVPRIRYRRIHWKTLAAYRRRSPEVDAAVRAIFIGGVSTRGMAEVLSPLLGAGPISASSVSRITRALSGLVRRYHHRPLEDRYRYLMLDGVYLQAKSPASVQRRCVLVAYGVRTDGLRELIDFQMAGHGESQPAWEAILTRLKLRGLEGANLKLAVIDGNAGLRNALDLVWPGLPYQRCWAHKLRNVANYVPRRLQKACTNQAREIYDASSYGKALEAFRAWKAVWNPIVPKAVRCLELDLESLLTVYRVAPAPWWKKLRTTNLIERVFREVRRRTRPMSCFQNTDSVERILFALFQKQNSRWEKKPLRQITQTS
jgi:putative transposase